MKPDFSKGLLPAVVQDALTHAVLMVGYMDEAAYEATLRTGRVTFYSRSKGRLWVKGETSGHYLELVEVRLDCDGDALLVRVRPAGPTCHRSTYSCFSQAAEHPWRLGDSLSHLWRLIQMRAAQDDDSSYTVRLLRAGRPRIAQKVGEEASEVMVAALVQGPEALIEEATDLLYHLVLLLCEAGVPWESVIENLRKRHTYSHSPEKDSHP